MSLVADLSGERRLSLRCPMMTTSTLSLRRAHSPRYTAPACVHNSGVSFTHRCICIYSSGYRTGTNVNKYSLTTATCRQRWWTNRIQLDLFLGVEQRTVGCRILNQSQQSSSLCFGESANHSIIVAIFVAAAGGYHLRRLGVTVWFCH